MLNLRNGKEIQTNEMKEELKQGKLGKWNNLDFRAKSVSRVEIKSLQDIECKNRQVIR